MISLNEDTYIIIYIPISNTTDIVEFAQTSNRALRRDQRMSPVGCHTNLASKLFGQSSWLPSPVYSPKIRAGKNLGLKKKFLDF